MYLIGLYVSEGYIEKGRSKNRIIICQNKGKKWDQMWKWVEKLNPTIRSPRKFYIKLDDYWFNFIKENCGESKYHKFLSPVILNNKYLNSLFDAMMLGDGHTKGNLRHYYTTSINLKNSFEELCLKLGWETSTWKTYNLKSSIYKGYKIKATVPCYTINIRKSKNKKIIPKKHISKEKHNDYVYCVEVPNHTVYVKRNGKSTWCGNSGTSGIGCRLSNRGFIGFEQEKKFFNMAKKRHDIFDINNYPGYNYSTDKTILLNASDLTKKQKTHIKNNIPSGIKTEIGNTRFF